VTCTAEGGIERFRDFLSLAPVVGEPSNLDTKKPPASGEVLSEHAFAIATKCGITKEQYLAELKYERDQLAS
jgi:hypothetical protein